MANAEEPGSTYWALVSPFWLPLNESWGGGAKAFLAEATEVPAVVLDLYAGHWCQSEVNNGGFHQFFSNTTGILAPEALRAFERMGFLSWSQVLAKAIAYFGDAFPRERVDRLRILPEASTAPRAEWDPFVELDDQFYDSADSERNRWEVAADAYARGAV